MKNYLLIFLYALVFNWLWEHGQAPLYVGYQGGAINENILLHASFVDALIITILTMLVRVKASWRARPWLIIVFGLIVAIALERWALAAGRWAYQPAMPVIPLLSTGLTPTIQLGLLAYLCYRMVFKKKS